MSSKLPEYICCGQLTGVKGAINVLEFSKDGKLLLSGGDDGCVRIWSTQDFSCEQVLHSTKWAQVTTITWITTDPSVEDAYTSIAIGTGRGCVDLCPMSKGSTWFSWKNTAFFTAFNFNDAVEAQVYDSLNRRLAVASHSGQIKIFSVDKCITLVPLWTANITNTIPQGLAFFGGVNQSLLVHGLETGEMCCRDAQTSTVLWTKTLAGGVGHAALSPDETMLIVDNLTTGTFDVYRFPASTPSLSFSSTSVRRFTKQCVFVEGRKLAICGSDNSRVYVVDVSSGETLQSLRLGTEHDLVQVVASVTLDNNRSLIAGGSNGGTTRIFIWEKKHIDISDVTPDTPKPQLPTKCLQNKVPPGERQIKINILLLANTLLLAILILLVSYPNWSPFFWKLLTPLSNGLTCGADFLSDLGEFIDDLNGTANMDIT